YKLLQSHTDFVTYIDRVGCFVVMFWGSDTF
ncbi:MAG: hypothetical protein QG642_20, partial [Patescibacteria group bacterium]|nr:hypothetical protein [Patescibacteria group bacterium]